MLAGWGSARPVTLDNQPGAETAPNIVIITVQYKNVADTASFVACLGLIEGIAGCELIIVDNDSTGADSAELQKICDNAPCALRLIRPRHNLYYWGGAAVAIEALSGSGLPPPHWVIVCNNDVDIEDPWFLRRLRLLDPSSYPIVAPTIISEATGKDQNPFLIEPAGPLKRLKWRIYDVDYRVATAMLATHRVLKHATMGVAARFSPFRRARQGEAAQRKIYAPHGSFVIFSKAFFDSGAVLDTTVPMFAEELTLAAVAHDLKLGVWHVPDLKVSHREHSTTGVELTEPKYELERMARKHYFSLTV